MKIMMIGHSGVGKTTYVACMYAVMFEAFQSKADFGIVADDKSDHEAFIELATKVVEEGVYPSPTAWRSEYKFHLTYKGNPVLPFTWVDYRGNALNESAGTAAMKKLLEDLKGASAILAFFEAAALVAKGSRRNPEVARLKTILTAAVNDRDDHMPIVLVVTKTDELPKGTADQCIEPLRELIQAINRSKTIQGALIDTICGRKTLQNITGPVLFALRYGLVANIVLLRQTIEQRMTQAKEWHGKSNFLGTFFGELFGADSYDKMHKKELIEIEREIEIHNTLIDPVNALEPRLKNVFRF